MDFEGTKAAILKVEQAISLMDSRMQHKLRPDQREALANAILSSGAQDDLLFHRRTARTRPALWTLGGLAAAIRMQWARRVRKQSFADESEQLSLWAATVRRSGARRLLIAMLIGLVAGLINLGLPVELAIQVLRDKARPVQASGDIVVVAKDEASRQAFGQLPWSRRYDAMLLDRLREMGARRIVFNEVFDSPLNPGDDTEFAAALERARGRVWLGAFSERDEATGKRFEFQPLKKFRMNCCLANSYIFYNSFGYVNKIRAKDKINGIYRNSPALILSNNVNISADFRPDSAIIVNSIPVISAKSLINSDLSKFVKGKSVLIGGISGNSNDKVHVLGQGKFSSVYVHALAAETALNGKMLEIGWELPLFLVFFLGIFCLFSLNSTIRQYLFIIGFTILFSMAAIGDLIGFHFELFPALTSLLIFGLRDRIQRRFISASSSDPLSGLPSISELFFIPRHDKKIVCALKVERFSMHTSELDPISHRDFVRTIAARINIIFPHCVVHQGEDGLFVWLIPDDNSYDPLSYIAQINALFRIPVGTPRGSHDVGVAIGFGSNLNEPFAARLAVAADRARVSLFGTLTSVR